MKYILSAISIIICLSSFGFYTQEEKDKIFKQCKNDREREMAKWILNIGAGKKVKSFLGYEFGSIPADVVLDKMQVKVKPIETLDGFVSYFASVDSVSGLHDVMAQSEIMENDKAEDLMTNTIAKLNKSLGIEFSKFTGLITDPLYMQKLFDDDYAFEKGDFQTVKVWLDREEIPMEGKVGALTLSGRSKVTVYLSDNTLWKKHYNRISKGWNKLNIR